MHDRAEDEALPLGGFESYDHWERYAWTLAELDFGGDRGAWEGLSPFMLASLLDRELREITSRVRIGGAAEDWYSAVALYHLVVEGVLAVSGQRTLLGLLRRCDGLTALEQGLLRIARDESRHIGFGVAALREGVKRGQGEAIADRVVKSIGPAVTILVAPERPFPTLLPAPALRVIGTDANRRW